ncbi:acyl-CoA dehydrogenase family protein [Streptomyces sp. NPDC058320]|uniref:acyl-CoA dehydrogenase family protein n=1 Tax=unclassified Streptomyces TaxID=2593676 RepID=UPI003638ABAE
MTATALSAFTSERAELAATVRRLMTRQHDETQVRRWMEVPDEHDRAVWAELAGGIGATALPISEKHGGAGFSYADLLPVFEEAGRALYGGPLLSTALATATLQAAGDDDACLRLLPGIADGTTTAALALLEQSDGASIGWDPAGIRTRAERSGAGWTLTGTKTAVIDGCTADLLVVPARTEEGVRLFAVYTADVTGLMRHDLRTVDLTRKQARIAFDATPAIPVGVAGAGWPAVRAALDHAVLFLAAECLGTARRALDEAVAYACTRHQFSRPIGSFQAIKHRLADMWVAAESAAVLLSEAGDALERTGVPVPLDTEHAFLACAEALALCAQGNVSVHGGIGFTWEHPAHLSYRRARNAQSLLGPLAAHRERLADLAGLPGGTTA